MIRVKANTEGTFTNVSMQGSFTQVHSSLNPHVLDIQIIMTCIFRSLFLSRVIQRQQDHQNDLGPHQQPPTQVESDLDNRLQSAEQGFQSFSQIPQHLTSSTNALHQEENVGPQSLSRYSLSESPPAVNDIDSKLNIIEKSLTERDDLVREMNVVKKKSDQRLSNVGKMK
jgi:hypothetical protein